MGVAWREFNLLGDLSVLASILAREQGTAAILA